MHNGTFIISAILGGTALIAIIAWTLYWTAEYKDSGYSLSPRSRASDFWMATADVSVVVAGTFSALFIVALIIGGSSLGAAAAQSYKCELTAQDLNQAEWDYSWIRKCRIEVQLNDGTTILTNPRNIRLTEDLRIAVTDPRP